MPDSSVIDQALIETLQADAALAALAQPGPFVFWEQAPAGSSQFVIVSLVDQNDVPMFGGRAWEDAIYQVKFVERSSVAVSHVKAAAARIDALLDDGSLAIEGYRVMVMQRVKRIRFSEDDADDSSVLWQHRGGHYQVMVHAT